jgi:hypothetical protein
MCTLTYLPSLLLLRHYSDYEEAHRGTGRNTLNFQYSQQIAPSSNSDSRTSFEIHGEGEGVQIEATSMFWRAAACHALMRFDISQAATFPQYVY